MDGRSAKRFVEEVIESIDAGLVWPRKPRLPTWVASVAGPAAIGLAIGLTGCGSHSDPVEGDADTVEDADVDDGGSEDADPPEDADVDDGGPEDADVADADDDGDVPHPVEDCTDHVDNDGDGRCDCADTECAEAEVCQPMCPAYGGPFFEENCSDCRDGLDCDGLIDCDDPDCDDDPACAANLYGVPFA